MRKLLLAVGLDKLRMQLTTHSLKPPGFNL
jgi:hypothetical protein